MNFKQISRIIVLCLFVSSATAQPGKQTVTGNNTFAFELFKIIFKKDSNVFLSPYSISSAMVMTYAGARNETERQMSRVLHYDVNQVNTHQGFFEINSTLGKIANDSTIKLSLANALWKSETWGFKKDYLELMQKYYDASIFSLKGAKPINDWANKKTNGKIKEIVKDTDLDNARLVLTNAIYFKGDWITAFDEKKTKKNKFRTINNKEIDVDMMFQVNEAKYFEDAKNQILELPYKGESIVMTIILPTENSSIFDLESTIDYKLFFNYNAGLIKQKVNIYLPKFSFTSEFHLEKVLPEMGMPDAFSTPEADFTGMSAGLSISKVIHKAFIEVNEKGSEATAVTAVVMKEKSAIHETTFEADRPFMILIRDTTTNSILFMGSIMNPAQ